MFNKIIKKELDKIKPSKKEIFELKKITRNFLDKLKLELEKFEHGGEVFVGGSFAKNTLMKRDSYDIDIFVRFSWKYDNISDLLAKPLNNVCKKEKLNVERIHGSRDYFRVYSKNHKAYFEIIPVTKIKKPREERNVTDLSYFHVSYIKKKIKGLEDDVIIAKRFLQAQKVYGAETYVRGFSGYAIELLIIKYRGFLKMLKELSKVKNERIVIDIEKHYKRKNEVFLELNESKLQSPIILIDPTYKERNALASLSRETFRKFQEVAKKFLNNPSEEFFEDKTTDNERVKLSAEKNKGEFVSISIKTDRQPGDIAGTKLKKFSIHLIKDIEKYFSLIDSDFYYGGKNESCLFLAVKSKKEIIQIGPPNYSHKLRKHIKLFKEKHGKNVFIKNNSYHAKIKINFTCSDLIKRISKEEKEKFKEMGVTEIKID